jgi:hypothetical protein
LKFFVGVASEEQSSGLLAGSRLGSYGRLGGSCSRLSLLVTHVFPFFWIAGAVSRAAGRRSAVGKARMQPATKVMHAAGQNCVHVFYFFLGRLGAARNFLCSQLGAANFFFVQPAGSSKNNFFVQPAGSSNYYYFFAGVGAGAGWRWSRLWMKFFGFFFSAGWSSSAAGPKINKFLFSRLEQLGSRTKKVFFG